MWSFSSISPFISQRWPAHPDPNLGLHSPHAQDGYWSEHKSARGLFFEPVTNETNGANLGLDGLQSKPVNKLTTPEGAALLDVFGDGFAQALIGENCVHTYSTGGRKTSPHCVEEELGCWDKTWKLISNAHTHTCGHICSLFNAHVFFVQNPVSKHALSYASVHWAPLWVWEWSGDNWFPAEFSSPGQYVACSGTYQTDGLVELKAPCAHKHTSIWVCCSHPWNSNHLLCRQLFKPRKESKIVSDLVW